MTFKGIFEEFFPEYPGGIDFLKWMQICMPLSIVVNLITIVYVQFFYLGLFRPNSADAKAINIGKEGVELANGIIRQKIKELGGMSFHEFGVLMVFLLCVNLWIFRSPKIFPGWADVLTDVQVKDSCAGMFGLFLLFVIPASPTFIHFFSSDEEKRPNKPSGALVTWKALCAKMPWGLAFLIGGGLTIADAAQNSGMSDMVAAWLSFLKYVPRQGILVIGTVFAVFATQIISSNVAVANILLPIYASICQAVEVNPLYITMPAGIGCSFAYSLPISTPPNVIASVPINMTTLEIVKIGSGCAALGCICIILWYMTYAPLFDDFSVFPEWAQR